MSIINKIVLLFTAFLLVSCDQFGSSHIANIVDLTKKVKVEEPASVLFLSKAETDIINYGKSEYFKVSNHSITAEPLVAKKIVYSINKNGDVTAYSIKNKKVLWKTNIAKNPAEDDFTAGGIAMQDGRLYVTNGTKYLTILNSETGLEIFNKAFPDIIRLKPIIDTYGNLLIQTQSNYTYSLDAHNYKINWEHESGLGLMTTGSYISASLHDNMVIICYTSGEITALKAKSGEPIWRYNLNNNFDLSIQGYSAAVVNTQPIIYDDYMYITTGNGRLIKLSTKNGMEVFNRNFEDIQSFSLYQDKLIVTNNARQVFALSSNNGIVRWVGNLITEKERAKKKVLPSKFLKPFVSVKNNETIISVPSDDGMLYRFNLNEYAKSGSEVWPSEVKPILKDARYIWRSCCNNSLYFINEYYFQN